MLPREHGRRQAHVAHTGSARGRWLLGQGSAGHGAWRKVKPRGRGAEVAAIRDRWMQRLGGLPAMPAGVVGQG